MGEKGFYVSLIIITKNDLWIGFHLPISHGNQVTLQFLSVAQKAKQVMFLRSVYLDGILIHNPLA
jgi:hypothetical protein